MSWSAFAGLVVGVSDLASAEAEYAALLGLAPAWSGAWAGAGSASSGFVLSNALLELRAAVGEGEDARWLRHRIRVQGEGLAAIALAAADPSGCARELLGRGIDVGAAEPAPPAGARSPLAAALRVAESATRGIPVLVVEGAGLPLRSGPTPGASVGALDHVVVASRGLEASRTVWGDGLGLRLALDRRFEARGLRILFYRLAGVTVEITGPLGAETGDRVDAAGTAGARSEAKPSVPSAGGTRPGPDVFFGAAWRVADLVAVRERVAAAGFDVSEARPGHKPGTLVCNVRSGTRGVATLLIGPALA